MRYLTATVLGLIAGVGVIFEFRHIGVSIDGLTGLVAVAVDGGVTLLAVYIWGELAASSANISRWHREAQERTDARRAADQRILDTANLARADW